jgi:putative membrane-bound dehydrogenase-like protein
MFPRLNSVVSPRKSRRAAFPSAATAAIALALSVSGLSPAQAAEGGAQPKPAGSGHPNGPEAAAADVAKMTPGAGLEATLFASEPMLVNPADMDIDERGRIWVTEGANYRSTFQRWGVLRPGGDRIVILEDSDADGRADKQTVFYQDMTINTALGICVLGNKVIVSCSPHVFVLTDTDGDSKADKRELLFEDTSKGDHDHCLHAFVFGPDGKLYFNFGNEVRELRRPKGGLMPLPLNGPVPKHESEPVIDLAGRPVKTDGKPYRQGMALRCNLDGSGVESIGWNFRNNYELAVDSFGTVWQSDNDDDGNKGVRINFVMEFGNYGFTDEMTGAGWGTAWKKAQGRGAKEDEKPFYHWHQHDPGVVPNLLQTGNGSPTGICIYEGNLLPQVYWGQMLHCDAGPRVVRAYPVQPNGAGYRATTENLLTSGDGWYRPSDVCVAPDGSVYIADWHDAGVGGHNMADRALETMTGRVYRVAPKGHRPSVRAPDLSTVAGCISALQSPNQATRYLAWTRLHAMKETAEPELALLWRLGLQKSPESQYAMRARALQLLARIPGRGTKYVNEALKMDVPEFRVTGLRIARSLGMDMLPLVKKLAKDSSPAVRRECAIALRGNPSPKAADLWVTLAQQHDGQDRWYLEALGIAMAGQEDAFFGAWLKKVGKKWNTPAGRDIVWRARSTKAPALIAQIVTDKATTPADKDRFLRSLDFIKGPEKDAALVEISTSLLN